MVKVKKITKTIPIQSNVQAQGCLDDCEEKMWTGKNGYNQSGCYYTTVYTPRGNRFFKYQLFY